MKTDFSVKIYSDGAVLEDMIADLNSGLVTGFTTNPSLMKKAGVSDYLTFAQDVLEVITEYPVSFEVFADDLETMKREAKKIASLGDNVYVKIPITNSKGDSTIPIIKDLSAEGIKVNVTAIFTLNQVEQVVAALSEKTPSIVSVFAGRVADTGVDPEPLMASAKTVCQTKDSVELLWASPREVFNIYQADKLGVDIITCTPGIIKKLNLKDKDLEQYSLETVQTFLSDSKSLGFSIL
ncbi:transaldolase [Streptococcus zalophi]|uniref:Transaldolase n=1 Tax=Streptococcus zalophi TaxID=640031 RepID=A0A934PBE2_9STRE|nr:transaldolase [Streptococcus zalophi]MBJ8350226.1 transaldolase [Streptococcus zalophi]MCR8967534.1 transaldolase [Streptococcus zalophi]